MFRELLGDGSRFGVSFFYTEQPSPDGLAQALIIAEEFLDGAPSISSLVIIFSTVMSSNNPGEADNRERGATIFGYHVSDPTSYGVVEFISQEKQSPWKRSLQSPNQIMLYGLYFYDEQASARAKALQPSPCETGNYRLKPGVSRCRWLS